VGTLPASHIKQPEQEFDTLRNLSASDYIFEGSSDYPN
jgi:hypothetical protein